MKKNLFILLLLSILSINVYSDEALETNSFAEIDGKVTALNKKYGAENVLIVLDIDNTVLTMPQGFGSDQWFSWQYGDCIGKKPLPKNCITSSVSELLDLQGRIFAVANMVPTEKRTIEFINKVQARNQKLILLTSRGPEFRDATMRSLKNVGLSFARSAIGPQSGYAATYEPYSLKNLEAYGLTKQDAEIGKLKKPRQVSYMNGVSMNSGQHKGIILKSLLHKTKHKTKAVVFVDDHKKHVERMQDIFGKNNPIEMVTYRYGKIDADVEAFNKNDKKIYHQAYLDFENGLKKVFK